MININELNESIAKAEEFIIAAKQAKIYLQLQAQFNDVPANRQPTYTTYGRPLANVRRVSMPLTFILADLRKYSNYK